MTAVPGKLSFAWSRPSGSTIVEFCACLGDALHRYAASRCFLVADARVMELWGSEIRDILDPDEGDICLFNALEENKSPTALAGIWRRMDAAGVTRETTLIGLGGGLTCDIAALAASTWHRGTGLSLVPTTVLAMADACLGGKTAVNLEGAKNQVGTFYPAGTILIAGDFVNTLPPRDYRNGMAEILKAGLIGDRKIGDLLASPPERDGDHCWLQDLVRRSLRVKGGIVSEDLTETGPRRLLNLGHTLGHALESVSGFSLSHGEAVGLGTVAAAHMAGRKDLAGVVRELLGRIGLPDRLHHGTDVSIESMETFLRRDKKTSGDGRTWVFPFDWEDCRLVKLDAANEQRLLQEALDFLLNG